MWCMSKKSAVYSWRVSPDMKSALEAAARRERASVSALLERAAREWLARSRGRGDDTEQRRLLARVRRCLGSIRGDDPSRAERSRVLVRARLRGRHAR